MNLVNDIRATEDDYKHVNCIIEIPKGTNTKYEYNEDLNVFELTRCLVSSLQYPINYGFIPQTIALDKDPLDVLVFNHDPIDRGTLVSCRVLGVMGFEDNGEIDNKLIAVPYWSPKEKYNKLKDIEPEHLKIYRQFFKIYKLDRKSETKVGDWRSASIALKTVKESHDRWKEENKDRFQQEWANRQFFSKLKNGLLPHPD
jgi:inorganic pyrophosphatase